MSRQLANPRRSVRVGQFDPADDRRHRRRSGRQIQQPVGIGIVRL
nr:hypothetical protein [Sphingobium lactosutens]